MSLLPAIAMWGLAIMTVVLGCEFSTSNSEAINPTQYVDLNLSSVLLFPITASVMLLLLFYQFWLLQYIMLAVLGVSAVGALMDVMRWAIVKTFRMSAAANSNLLSLVTLVITCVVIWMWAYTGNFVAHDIIGCSLCITFIQVLRFPSLKLASICLALLFLYDLFWVFYSEFIFSENVMVSVATKQAASPLQQAGRSYNIALLKQATQHIELPLKLLIPTGSTSGRQYIMLGLGDIALPGVLCNLAHRTACQGSETADIRSPEDQLEKGEGSPILSSSAPLSSPSSSLLFPSALAGYSVGLAAAFYFSMTTGHAQPALVYIVPGIFMPLVTRAWSEGRLLDLWHGPKIERLE